MTNTKSKTKGNVTVTVRNILLPVMGQDVDFGELEVKGASVAWTVGEKSWVKRFETREEANDFANKKWAALKG